MHDLGGGVQGAATIDFATTHTDNFFYQSESSNPVSANGYFIKPFVAVDLDGSATSVKFRAAGEYSSYDLPSSISAQDEYLDGIVNGELNWKAGTRNLINLFSEYRRGHDALGVARTNSATTFSGDADYWNQFSAIGTYRIGASDATFNLELAGRHRDRTYTTNEVATQYLDYKTNGGSATLFFRYSPKTSALVQVSHDATTFDRTAAASPSKDGQETKYQVGLQWKATAKTTGDLRAGLSTHKYDAASKSYQRASWIGSVSWTPAARSVFTFTTGRASQESYLNQALSIENETYALDWNQQWARRFSTTLAYRYVQSDFINQSVSSFRHDDINSLALSAEYSMVKYLSIVGGVTDSKRTSTSPGSNYRALITFFGLRLQL